MARLFDLPETRGFFQLKGIVSGMEKDSAFKEISTKTGEPFRMLNFGVSYADGETLYLNIQGMEQDNVYFSKRDPKTKKSVTEKVPWAQRDSFNKEGFRLIGNNIGVKKITNADGKVVNDRKTLTDFDTCKEVKDNLKDGASVFTLGRLDISSYVTKNGDKRTSTKLVPQQISLCSDIDFADEKYEQANDFEQILVFMGIAQEVENDKPTGRFVLSAKIVTYNTIEDIEFIVADKELASTFKKNLKPYTAIKVSGHMVSSVQTEEVEDDDCWGEPSAMRKVSAPTRREFIITGATKSSIDKKTYSEDKMNEAYEAIIKSQKAENDFGDNDTDEWGESSSVSDEEEAEW